MEKHVKKHRNGINASLKGKDKAIYSKLNKEFFTIICSLQNCNPVRYILFIYHTQRNYSMLHLEKSDQLNNQRQL